MSFIRPVDYSEADVQLVRVMESVGDLYASTTDAIRRLTSGKEVEIPMSLMRELESRRERLEERIQFIGARAFIHLDPKTGTWARIVDYNTFAGIIYYVHEDNQYNTDVKTNTLHSQRVETIELHEDTTTPTGQLIHVWISGYVPPSN